MSDRHHELRAEDLTLGYDGVDVVRDLDLAIPDGRITADRRRRTPAASRRCCAAWPGCCARAAARCSSTARSVPDLRTIDVAQGARPAAADAGRARRHHRRRPRRPRPLPAPGLVPALDAGRRRRAVAAALEATGTADLVDRPVAELSGGQRQRVWVAMALAQDTDLLLLDEPTTFLDINHQVELLDLLTDLNRRRGKTIVDRPARPQPRLPLRRPHHRDEGRPRSCAEGAPRDVVDAALVTEVFGLDCEVVPDPVSGTPMVVPRGRHHTTDPERQPNRNLKP